MVIFFSFSKLYDLLLVQLLHYVISLSNNNWITTNYTESLTVIQFLLGIFVAFFSF